jgi:YD repeat-containing protein
MKRSLFSFTLCLLLYGTVAAQSSRVRVGDAFKGPVRSVRIERAKFSEVNGEYKEGPLVLVVTKTYAADWSSAEYTGYNADGSISQKIVTTYNPDGGETSISVFNGEGKLKSKVAYLYKDGRVVEEDRFDGEGVLQQKRVTVSDDKGALVEARYYDGKDALIKREVNTRDAQKSTWTTYDANGKVVEEAVHYLNYGGPKKTEVTKYNADGTVAVKTVSEADVNVGQIDKADYNRGGTVTRKDSEKREYDAQGNLSKITNYKWDEAAGKFRPVSVSYYTIIYSDTK